MCTYGEWQRKALDFLCENVYNRNGMIRCIIPRKEKGCLFMRNSMKRALVICLVAAMSAMAFGCSDEKKDDSSVQMGTVSQEDLQQELQFVYGNGNAPDSTEAAEDSNEPATEIVTEVVTEVVTEYTATEYVAVTDAAGEQVTEADGAVQTEVREVVQTEVATEIVTEVVTAPAGDSGEHTPSYDTCKAYWLDMTQQGDFTFNGEFLVLEFQIKEDIPDGNYPINITYTDIGSWELVSRYPECVAGEITVGDAEPGKQAEAADDAFTLTVESVAAKQGDTAKVVINMENNPGFCGFVIDIQYDAAAMSIVKSYGGSDFDDAAVKYLK